MNDLLHATNKRKIKANVIKDNRKTASNLVSKLQAAVKPLREMDNEKSHIARGAVFQNL